MTVRNRFDRELEDLHSNMVLLGAKIEEAIDKSVKAIISQDSLVAQQVIEGDTEINRMTSVIEGAALKILLRQQPVASDLRTISTALKIVTDMERIGNQAADICSIVISLCEEEYKEKLVLIPKMGELAKKMVNKCIDSFIRLDIELAKSVITHDDEMDVLFNSIKENMIKFIKNHAAHADQAIYLMMVAKYFEKIGDHAENIAEWVIFCKTGEKKNMRLI